MAAYQTHRPALSEASNRGNIPQAPRPVGQKKKKPADDGATAVPSFAEFMAMSNMPHHKAETPGFPGQPASAPPPNVAVAVANTPKTAAATGSKKRKAETTLEEDIAAYKQNLDDTISPDIFEDESLPSCSAVRGRINKLLDSGIMTKIEFARAIGGKAASLNRFLQASGQMGGSGSSVYYNAWAWFRQREVAKLKMPDVKKRQRLEADAAAAAATVGVGVGVGTGTGDTTLGTPNSKRPTAPGTGTSTGRTLTTVSNLPDISGIHIPGEETDSVAVYDTCDEVRRKINAHLRTPGLTQTEFCRAAYAQLRAPRCKGIQSKQLADFRAMKGARAGARSSVFYAAYVYFEKLRIALNRPKTAHRETMEALWGGYGGFDREQDHRTSYVGIAGMTLVMDQYGMTRLC